MSDSGETTIQGGVAALIDLLRDEVQADPPTAGAPFRRVVEGPTGLTEHPRPFVSVHVVSARVVSAVDGDKLVSVALVLRVVGDAIGAGAHAAMLQLVGAVEDAVESWEDDGVVAGVMGFEAWDWRMAPGESAGGVKTVSAEARVGSWFAWCAGRIGKRACKRSTRPRVAWAGHRGTGKRGGG